MRNTKVLPAMLLALLLAMTVSTPAHAGTKTYPVEGSAMTEPLACRAAIRITKTGKTEKDIVSTSPCRCVEKYVNHHVCTVDLTIRTKD
ncbi:hypothetical protein SPHFLASMR4Y_03106 [Sphingorhabdus sp. SMR4y]|nr:hypothetical protein SPHFLASMR4Y_03106 [Sphingorhabdus sp. SMR4y]